MNGIWGYDYTTGVPIDYVRYLWKLFWVYTGDCQLFIWGIIFTRVTRFIHKSGKELVTLVDILVLLEILLLFTYAWYSPIHILTYHHIIPPIDIIIHTLDPINLFSFLNL